jgi:hypothetical protein
MRCGDYEDAEKMFGRSLYFYDRFDGRGGAANSHFYLGIIEQRCGKSEDAAKSYRNSLKILGMESFRALLDEHSSAVDATSVLRLLDSVDLKGTNGPTPRT